MQKTNQWIQVVILFFIISVVYVSKITNTAGIDEMLTYFKYIQIPNHLFVYDTPNNHLLHTFLMWISTSVLGNSLIAIRLPAFISGLLALAMLYQLGNRWVDHRVGMISMILMSITTQFANYTVDGRGYTLSILFAIVLVSHLLNAYRTNKTNLFLTYILVLGTLLVLPSSAFLVLSLISWQLLTGWYFRQAILVKTGIVCLISLVIGTLLYILLVSLTEGGGITVSDFRYGYTNINGFIVQTILTLFENPMLSLLSIVFFVGGLVVFFTQKYHAIFPVFIGFTFASIIILTLGQWIVFQRLFFPRNYLYLLPLISIVGALGIHQLSILKLNRIIPIFVFVIGLWGIHNNSNNERITMLLNSIEENAQVNDLVFVKDAIAEPLYYHISLRQEMASDYFSPSRVWDRIVILTISDEDETKIKEIFDLDKYTKTCEPETWSSRTVITCSIIQPPNFQETTTCLYSFDERSFSQCGSGLSPMTE